VIFNFLPFTNIFWMLCNILEILVVLIIVDVIISWAMMFGARGMSNNHPWVRALHQITNPVLAPFRTLWDGILNVFARQFRMRTYVLRGIDLSPFLAIIALQIVWRVLFMAGA
jgi:uncharacterized protein YggT (Ycf19 family)